MSESDKRFVDLGKHLKFVREQAKKSLAEVSGAVEIDERHLERIEAGIERPDEEILMLLINHFGLKDREAVQLWESAHYESDMPDEIRIDNDSSHLAGKTMVMLLALDSRTVYSDGAEVVVNPAGVTINFTQNVPGNQQNIVSRVGMSHQQAEAVIKSVQTALLHAKYGGNDKLLPPSTN